MAGGAVAWVVAVMLAYLGLLLAIGWAAAKRTHGGEDFHLAGRSLGAWAAGISSTASSESGWVTLGAVGMTYTMGVAGLWFAPGCLLGYLVNLYLVAPRLRRISRDRGYVTLVDLVCGSSGDRLHTARIASVLVIVLAMTAYVVAQMSAAGKAFAATLGLTGWGGYAVGVLVGAAVITLVTAVGGFTGVAWTDLFQGLLVAASVTFLPLFGVAKLGGFKPLLSGLAQADPSLLTATGTRAGAALLGFVVGQLGIGLGYPGMPHVITRYMATRDEREMRRLKLIAMLWGVVVFYGAGMVGLVARVMLPNIADPERALMRLALHLLHPALAGLMLAAVISAILSTVSSQLLVAASAVSYDVVERIFGKARDDKRSLMLGRITVAAVGLAAVLLALPEAKVVYWFVLFAWSALGAAFAPLVLAATSGLKVSRTGALAGILTGVGVTVVWKLGLKAMEAGKVPSNTPWIVAVVVFALFGLASKLARAADRAALLAILVASAFVVLAGFIVKLPQLSTLYELPPAFLAASLAAVLATPLAKPSPQKGRLP